RAAGLEPPAVVRTTPLEQLGGRSLRDLSPVGPYANTLLQLLTTGQMLLARHPVNQVRRQAGRLPLNTPWIWGVDQGLAEVPAGPAGRGCCWTADPVVAGLARANGCTPIWLDEQADLTPLVTSACRAMTTGRVLLHLAWPAVLTRHGLLEERRHFLQRVNDQLLEPLTHQLAQTDGNLMIALCAPSDSAAQADGQVISWVSAAGSALVRRRRFWQRGRVERGMLTDAAPFLSMWSL
ncbi:MAG: hypothetical protein H7838_03545, partial [Magnetococcus sp. DMHC-8]